MQAIDVLIREHLLVRRLLRCLGALTVEARMLGSLDPVAATELLGLFERFVDWSHQDKEELHLFPRLLAGASAAEARRLAEVFGEHAEERRRLVGMYLHLSGACAGKEASVDRFITHSLIYQRLQRRHLGTEDGFVLPLGARLLTAEDDSEILRGFEAIDARFGNVADIEVAVDALCRRFDVDALDLLEEEPELEPVRG